MTFDLPPAGYRGEFDEDPNKSQYSSKGRRALRQATREAAKRRGERPVRHVYIVEGAGLLKIGSAFDIELRLRQLRAGSPVPIIMLGWIRDGGEAKERKLHKLFSRYRAHGEWFALSYETFKREAVAAGIVPSWDHANGGAR